VAKIGIQHWEGLRNDDEMLATKKICQSLGERAKRNKRERTDDRPSQLRSFGGSVAAIETGEQPPSSKPNYRTVKDVSADAHIRSTERREGKHTAQEIDLHGANMSLSVISCMCDEEIFPRNANSLRRKKAPPLSCNPMLFSVRDPGLQAGRDEERLLSL
jgi:hypothetical protein